MYGKTISEISVGDSAEFSKTLAESDIYLFAGITGDLNPFHVDEAFASNTVFKGRIAHGILLAGFVSAVIGCRLPGPGSIYVSQDLQFRAPARIGDTITARVRVLEVAVEQNRVVLETLCSNQHGTVVLEGTAIVSPKRAG